MASHSRQSRHFSTQETSYLSKVSVAMQNPIEIAVVHMWLQKAEAEGLDPRRIYDAAVRMRPPHWDPAPPFAVVYPVSVGKAGDQ
jgi:hypothetical protein